jgi:hypothetical protein
MVLERVRAIAAVVDDAVPEGAIIIDCSKQPIYLYALIATKRFDVAVIHLRRDPQAVVNSKARWARRFGRAKFRKLRALYLWWQRNRLISAVTAECGVGVIDVSYEEFAEDPEKMTWRIATELGRHCTSVKLRRSSKIVHHNIAGSPNRFSRGMSEVSLDDGGKNASEISGLFFRLAARVAQVLS